MLDSVRALSGQRKIHTGAKNRGASLYAQDRRVLAAIAHSEVARHGEIRTHGGAALYPAEDGDVRFMVGVPSLSIPAAAVTTSFRPRSCPRGVLMHCDMR
jgi:hypothetical protein